MVAGIQGKNRKSDEHAGLEPTWISELGDPLDNAGPWEPPGPVTLQGRYCTLVPLDLATQADELYAQMWLDDPEQRQWKYMAGFGPYASQDEWVKAWQAFAASAPNQTFAVRVHDTGLLTGQLSLLRLRPEHGSAEVGFVRFPPQMQRTRASTEAQFLLADYVLGTLKYRRYEWKCNAANQPSLATARRLGFTFEGTFRNDLVNHGRNRDTAWFSMIDVEWPAIKAGYQQWLDPANFDASGQQRAGLGHCIQDNQAP